MEWWLENWNYKDDQGHQGKNHFAVAVRYSSSSLHLPSHGTPPPPRPPLPSQITFGLYVPLMLVQLFKWYYKPSATTKKSWQYRVYNLVTLLLPLVAIIVGARVAYEIKKEDHFNSSEHDHSYYAKSLKILGEVPSGVHVGRIPRFRWPMSEFFADILPLTLISFMETWSIARAIASQKNQLHFLSASQEMWAVGLANLCGCVTSSYPATASFSRSALNASAGARSPLSSLIIVLGLLVVLTLFTSGLRFIPSAALSAIIYVAIANLITFSDFWQAWKHSKKDFFTMVVTTTFTFVFDTSIGLAVGLGCSVLMYCVFDIILAKSHTPRLFTSRREGRGVDVLRIESDLNFLTAAKIKDFIVALVVKAPEQPPATSRSLYLRHAISSRLDQLLKPNIRIGVDELPKAIVIDLCLVKTVDLSGLDALEGAIHEVRLKGVKVAIINVNPEVNAYLTKFGIHSDSSGDDINFERYEKQYFVDLWSAQEHTGYMKESAATSAACGKENEEIEYGFREVELPTIRDGHSGSIDVEEQEHILYGNVSQDED
jgi:MFS superfamily sulfate permease-like transporter